MSDHHITKRYPGRAAVATKGWLVAHRWLVARRLSQFTILLLFLLGPLAGIWLVEGNLSSSLTLEWLPLSDPFLLTQTLLAGTIPLLSGVIGGVLVVVGYALLGGRLFCSWVCPLNLVTDLAAWLRRRFDLSSSTTLSRQLRFWLLGLALLLPLLLGTLVWELINPVSLLQRGLLFGIGAGWLVMVAIFLFDLFVVRHGWCGHLCPHGAFYSLLGSGLVRVRADQRAQCDDCMECFAVCPEPQVIRPALKGATQGIGPVITDRHCTHCGRCIDVCAKAVFQFGRGYPNATVQLNQPNQSIQSTE